MAVGREEGVRGSHTRDSPQPSLPKNDNPTRESALSPDYATEIQKAEASNIWKLASQR